jgi:hypothetical protein
MDPAGFSGVSVSPSPLLPVARSSLLDQEEAWDPSLSVVDLVEAR